MSVLILGVGKSKQPLQQSRSIALSTRCKPPSIDSKLPDRVAYHLMSRRYQPRNRPQTHTVSPWQLLEMFLSKSYCPRDSSVNQELWIRKYHKHKHISSGPVVSQTASSAFFHITYSERCTKLTISGTCPRTLGNLPELDLTVALALDISKTFHQTLEPSRTWNLQPGTDL